MEKIFTAETLSRFNGENGLPILISCRGKVYDVTASYHWRSGRHHALHQSGQDLTQAMNDSPHGLDLLERFPVVGILEKSTTLTAENAGLAENTPIRDESK